MAELTEQEAVDNLVDSLSTSNLLSDYSVIEKPDNHENVTKAATSQREKRENNEVFENSASEIDKVESTIKTSMKTGKIGNSVQRQNRLNIFKKYKNNLMLSELFINIPKELHTSWTMVACPQGDKCLVVAENGITQVFNRCGVHIGKFKSGIPGGGAAGHGKTILDCIRHPKNKKQFYILDVLYANMMSFCEIEAVVRLNQLEALAEEIVINQKTLNEKKIPHFTVPPRCPCTAEEMEKMMSELKDFELMGLRFYQNNGEYIRGYTPLVGWLEAWMLPEVLNVHVHDCYKTNKNNLTVEEYVINYNKKRAQWKSLKKNVIEESKEEDHGFVIID